VAHDISNGKSFLVDLLATLITARWCLAGRDQRRKPSEVAAL
jgi:hypothetical protein